MSAFFAKIVAFFMAILAFFGIGKGNNPVNPTEVFKNDTVTVNLKDNELDIFMTANGSTGYTWTYDVKGDSVKFVNAVYENIDRGEFQIVGAPGIQHFYFEVSQPGITEINFRYLRTFEAGSTINECTLFITVAADLTVSITAA